MLHLFSFSLMCRTHFNYHILIHTKHLKLFHIWNILFIKVLIFIYIYIVRACVRARACVCVCGCMCVCQYATCRSRYVKKIFQQWQDANGLQ
jgi:hypothetical protein